MKYILALDQGTTSSRAILYDDSGRTIASSRQEFEQYYPRSGWVEHDANEIWTSVLETARHALSEAGLKADQIEAMGITNQRETLVVWDRSTGEPIHRAIVWQDRRTSEDIENYRASGHEGMVRKRTGLLLDPYFTSSKLAWILEHVEGARQRAAAGELAAGTIESWIVYKLTNGSRHITDLSNASRTMLMNLESGRWDASMMDLFGIPKSMLPEIVPTSGKLAVAAAEHLGAEIPICGLIGDQQSALFGQLCTEPGNVKCTYGTGCFLLMMLGPKPLESQNRLLTSVAWKLGDDPIQYALEGSVFVGGAAIQWLRDGMGMIETAAEVNELAAQVEDSGGLFLVPAFTGLGAPFWDPTARGAMLGITRGTTAAHVARATLEGIAYQVADLLGAMEADSGKLIPTLRVDGGASASDLLMQIQADLLNADVERPVNVETTALGAALMAGLGAGIRKNLDELRKAQAVDRKFRPGIKPAKRRELLRRWHDAVRRCQNWEIS